VNRKLYLNLPQIGREQADGEVTYQCPLCGKPKLGWNVLQYKGQCFACDRGYNDISIKRICTVNYMRSFAEDMGVDLEAGKVELRKPKYEFERMTKDNAEQIEARCFLMADKKLLSAIIDEHVWYSPQTREVGIPIQNIQPHPSGNDPTWMRRSIDRKGWFADAGIEKANYLFYAPSKHKHHVGEIIYLVEGVFDALSLCPWASAVSLLGTRLYPAQLEWLKAKVKANNNLPVFVWMDPDKAGQRAATEILTQLRFQAGIQCMVMIENNEPNDLTPEVISEMVLSGIQAYITGGGVTHRQLNPNPFVRRN
jgi:hypothetical protein